MRVGNWRLDSDRGGLVRGERLIPLTQHEQKLLRYFDAHPGRPLPRDELLREVWGLRGRLNTRTVDMNVARLRRKLAEALGTEASGGTDGGPLRTLFGTGYRYDPPETVGESVGGSIDLRLVAEPATAFFGREAELAALTAWRAGTKRCVTLLGPGGLGKTRLAREWLRRIAERAVWVDLRAVETDAALLEAVRASLGLSVAGTGSDAVAAAIGQALGRRGEALLVLDDFERVAATSGGRLSAWLAAAPSLRCLVTSRVSLGLPGQHAIEVGPLAPADAVRVLVDRAPAAAASPALDALATALDGIPLALELAAARLDVLTPKQLLARMDTALDLLSRPDTPGADERHSAFRKVLVSSWSLLSPAEQHFAAQISVLVADVPLSTLEAIVVPSASAWPPVVDLVAALRARSFLTARTERDVRLFGLYDLVRRFLLERLAEGGETAVGAHRAHVTAHFLAVASDALDQWWRSGEDESLLCLLDLEPHLLDIAQTARDTQHRAEAMLALEPVFANGGGAAERWRCPLLRMLDDPALEPALRDRLSLTLGWLEMSAGARDASQRLVDARVPPEDEDERTVARWAFLTGRLQHLAGRTEPALAAYAAAAQRAEAAGDAAIEADITAAQVILLVLPLRLTEAGALCRRAARLPVGPRFRAMLEARTGNVAAAAMENERALACFRRALLQLGEGPHPLARLTIETYAGAVQRELGQAEAVVALWAARLPAMRDVGNPAALCAALCQYGRGLLLLDRTDEAAPLFAESLALGQAMGFRGAIAEAQMDHGHLAFSRGAPVEARAAFERAAATFGDWLPSSARQARFLAAFVGALTEPSTPLPDLASDAGAAIVDLEAIAPVLRAWVAEGPEAAGRLLRGLPAAPGWRFHFWRRAVERRLSGA